MPVRITTAANDGTGGDEIKRLFGLMKSNQMATPRNFADIAALAIKKALKGTWATVVATDAGWAR